jgi:hypothetical protein
MSIDRHGFSESEWDALKAAPFHMLRHVAGADSHIDRKEISALVDAILAAADHDDSLVHALMEDLSDELHNPGELAALPADGALDALRHIAAILDSRPDRGARLRETLLEFGATIADSSGAQLTLTFAANHNSPGWTRSAGTSATERHALASAARALGTD